MSDSAATLLRAPTEAGGSLLEMDRGTVEALAAPGTGVAEGAASRGVEDLRSDSDAHDEG